MSAQANQGETPANVGLRRKYHGLRRTRDDSEVEGWYFVLRPYNPESGEYDLAAIAALEAYADACQSHAPELATDLRKQARGFREERGWQRHYLENWER